MRLIFILAWLFELAGGAIGDFENTCLPKEQREAAFHIAALHQWDLEVDDPRCISSAEDVSTLCFPSYALQFNNVSVAA